MGKNLPAKQEMQIQSLGWEDPPEKEMATLSSILAWDLGNPMDYSPWGRKELNMTEQLSLSI